MNSDSMASTNQVQRSHDNRPPGAVVVQLVGADPEADARAMANAMALCDNLEVSFGQRALLIVKDPVRPAASRQRVRIARRG